MNDRTTLLEGESNWETIVFIKLNEFLGGDNRMFLRKQFLSAENVDSMVKWSERLGHKERPKSPEETLQSTLQGMRKKGYIDFIRRGEWKLTKSGYEKMLETVRDHQDEIDKLDAFLNEMENL